MRIFVLTRYIGLTFFLNAIFLGISFLISLYYQENTAYLLLYCTIITTIFGIFPLIFVDKVDDISSKEGFMIVVLSWFFSCLIGLLPYIMLGGEFSFTNAWFESVSGYTTTGATILSEVESLPKGILFWRSSTHFMGGLGIVLFMLVVLPSMNQIKPLLFNIEVSSIAKESFRYRAKKILYIMLIVYFGLNSALIILLNIAGMDLFDAINHAFATIATGGFSTKNLSIAFYDSVAIEVIIMFFMILSGMHFGLLFETFRFRKNNIFKSIVVRYYVFSMLIGIIFISINLTGTQFDSFWQSLRYGSFQLLSLATTTGFASYDSAVWPAFSIMIIIFFTIQCGCAGSTSGGLKADRIVILWQGIKRQIKQLQHPNAIILAKIKHWTISTDLLHSTVLFIALYIFTIFISTLILTGMGVDILTSFSASAACIGNCGPGFGLVGSMSNYGMLPDAAKWLLSIVMFLGRLEIYSVILLVTIKFWR